MAKSKNRTSAIMRKHTQRLEDVGQVNASWTAEPACLTLTINLEIIKYHRHRHGRSVTYDPMNAYKKQLKSMIASAMTAADIELDTDIFTRPLKLETVYTTLPAKSSGGLGALALMSRGELARSKTPDIDNFSKTAYDVLNGLCWKDDSQIIDSHAQKRYGKEESSVIKIYYLDQYTGPMDYRILLSEGRISQEDIDFAKDLKNVKTEPVE